MCDDRGDVDVGKRKEEEEDSLTVVYSILQTRVYEGEAMVAPRSLFFPCLILAREGSSGDGDEI